MYERLNACNEDSWYEYFAENMNGLGLDAPHSLYGTAATAIETLGPGAALLGAWGTSMTVPEIIGATFFWEKIAVAAAGLGLYYVGAAIGSSAVATGRYLGCGTSLSDALLELSSLYPNNRGVKQFVWDNPEVVLPAHPSRPHYRMKAFRHLKGLTA